tara:strand:+ start:17 stop:271 length:255 start_codon:yes stop_codon:yes gene_type:complete
MKESSATIKLTQSEITHTIMALVMAKQASANLGNEYYEKMFDSLWKDFETIKNAIIEGEKEIETRNKKEEANRSGPKTCESCID